MFFNLLSNYDNLTDSDYCWMSGLFYHLSLTELLFLRQLTGTNLRQLTNLLRQLKKISIPVIGSYFFFNYIEKN